MESELAARGLFRTWVHDEELGIPRMAWAFESFCTECGWTFINIYDDGSVPDEQEILLVMLSPCPDCEDK